MNAAEATYNMDSGFIKIHRKLTEWEWYQCTNTKLVFLHLLLTANYKPSRFRGCDIPAGSVVTGRTALSEAVGISEQQLRTALAKLKSTGELTSKATNKFTIYYIVKWAEYQVDQPAKQHTDNQRVTNDQPTSNQQVTTSKEGKKVRKEEGKKETPRANALDYSSWPSLPSEQVMKDYLAMRAGKKAKINQTVITRLSAQLHLAVAAGHSMDDCLGVCIEKGWVGFKLLWLENSNSGHGNHPSGAVQRKGFEHNDYRPEI
ncbi:MAG: hypothetical protein ABUJ92_00675 [Desulfobacterales bacterium]